MPKISAKKDCACVFSGWPWDPGVGFSKLGLSPANKADNKDQVGEHCG